MNDDKTFEIKLSKKMFNLDGNTVLTKEQKKLFKDIIKKQTKEIKKHFNEDGWDLNFEIINSDILYEVFNVDFFALFAAEILSSMKGKIQLVHDKEFILRDPNYTPLFYDIKRDKIVEVHVSNKNVFIWNKNFVSLGSL